MRLSPLLITLSLFFLFFLFPISSDIYAANTPPFLGIPPNPVKPKNPDSWTFTKVNRFTPGSTWYKYPEKWNNPSSTATYDEKLVFHTTLKHTQDPHNSFELRIGKGSHIYSILAPWGETIPPQRANSVWIDAVHLTTVMPKEGSQEGIANNIHQSGVYGEGQAQTYYSPILYEQWRPNLNTYETIVWPQVSSKNGKAKSEFLFYNNIRDLGNGIYEIDTIYHNYGTNTAPSFNSAWSPVRTSNLPLQFLNHPDGTYTQEDLRWKDGVKHPIKDTGGVLINAAGSKPNSLAFGQVFGTDKYYIGNRLNFLTKPAVLNYGKINPTPTHSDQTTGGVRIFAPIPPDTSFFFRRFYIVNRLDAVKKYGNELSPYIEYGPIIFNETTNQTVSICLKNSLPTRKCNQQDQVLFYTYHYPINGAKPLFVMKRKSDNKFVISSDPYHFTDKPYEDKIEYVELLGWAMPTNLTLESRYQYKKLGNILDTNLFPATQNNRNLMVLTSTEPKSSPTPSPKLGLPAQAGDLNGDGRVDLFDFNLLVANFGNPYTIFDYNAIVANYGK